MSDSGSSDPGSSDPGSSDPGIDVDVVVVGAGPAGACAATVLARRGLSVVLLERGPFPGSKNMYGGVIYPRVLDQLHPDWWEEVPIQRWVTRRSTMVLTDTQALTVDFRSQAWGQAPFNGATAYRPDFDHWLAGKAEADGAQLICSTTAVGLLRDATGKVTGVRTDRPEGDLRARAVIACDGVNSFLAKEAGLYTETDAANYTVGVKETLALPREVIEQRFAIRGNEGVDIEILGGTSGVNGGGFVYTNLDTLAVGVVLKLPALAAQKQRPEEIIARLKSHPGISPLVEGGEIVEYSAHLIPEAGRSMMPTLTADGMLVAGDAAAMCLAAGIWLEGVNFAMASGMYAGEAVAEALDRGDTSAKGLAGYERRLNQSFVLQDHDRLRRAPSLVLSDRVQHQYPQFIANVAERMFRVDNPRPKPGLRRILREERKASGVRLRDLARDTWTGLRTFG
jgi:electron transfer flavoprotein-quinone oxidoreductase